ncbi:uncharacterized protein [Euphorbia lathyris]|uniref:uncharacterized protein n=1 Tax=Euphorbia lathyris TaxID=212925 RepID=UPI0033131CA8
MGMIRDIKDILRIPSQDNVIDKLNIRWGKNKPSMQQHKKSKSKGRVSWTFNSNAREGNSSNLPSRTIGEVEEQQPATHQLLLGGLIEVRDMLSSQEQRKRCRLLQ